IDCGHNLLHNLPTVARIIGPCGDELNHFLLEFGVSAGENPALFSDVYMNTKKIVVGGGGGFIGGHLIADLLKQGQRDIRAVDLKPFDEWYQLFPEVENVQLDLQDKAACEQALRGAATVYNLAADMGGMGFIENNRALCMLSVLINTHMLMAAKKFGVERFFYSSSACVYAADKQ